MRRRRQLGRQEDLVGSRHQVRNQCLGDVGLPRDHLGFPGLKSDLWPDGLDVSYNSWIVCPGGHGVMDGASASGACSMLTRVKFQMFLFSRV